MLRPSEVATASGAKTRASGAAARSLPNERLDIKLAMRNRSYPSSITSRSRRHEQTRDVGHYGCCDAWRTCHAEADEGRGPSEPGCDRALPRLRTVWAATFERLRSDR